MTTTILISRLYHHFPRPPIPPSLPPSTLPSVSSLAPLSLSVLKMPLPPLGLSLSLSSSASSRSLSLSLPLFLGLLEVPLYLQHVLLRPQVGGHMLVQGLGGHLEDGPSPCGGPASRLEEEEEEEKERRRGEEEEENEEERRRGGGGRG